MPGGRLRRAQAAAVGHAPGWRNARVSRLRASHSYGLVLALVIVSLPTTALVGDGEAAASVLVLLEAVILVVALSTAGIAPLHAPLALFLIVAAVAAALLPLVTGGDGLHGGLALLNAGLVAASIVVIGVGGVDQREVNRQSLRAAIAVYLLLGMFFVFVYGAVATLGSGPLFAQGTDASQSLRFYFSFVTLATLGYGDYTPAGEVGRLLAISEALLGQLYLVTVVALLVGRYRQPSQAPPP